MPATNGMYPLLFTLFLALGIGYLLRLTKRVPANAPDIISIIVVDVTLPALVIYVFATQKFNNQLWTAALVAYIAMFIVMGLAYAIGKLRKRTRQENGTHVLTSSFSNTGFMGVPFLSSFYNGVEGAAITAVMVDSFTSGILLYTFAVWAAIRFGNQGSLSLKGAWKLFLAPVIICVIIGVIISACGIQLPGYIITAADKIGHATAPMVFLAIGYRLDFSALKGKFGDVALITFLKLIILPLITFVLAVLFRLKGAVAEVTVLQMAMPTSMMSSIISARYGCNAEIGSGAVVLTTALTIISIPVTFELLRLWGF